MDPKDAALAFAVDAVSESMKGLTLKIDDPKASPPKSGEVGLRWISGNEYATPEEGITILKYDGYKSELLLSRVEIVGRASKKEIEAAVLKTDSHPLRRLVAQQTYEILWWLRHVRVDHETQTSSSATYSSGDDFGRFWMKPDGPSIEKAMMGDPCGQCIARNGIDSYETFAATLIRRLIERSGIKERYPKPQIGVHIDPDEDAKFLHKPPPKREDVEGSRRWIGRLTDILRKRERQYLYSNVMDILVPISDPLRYEDNRIDDALLEVLHHGLEAGVQLKKLEAMDQDDDFDSSKLRDPDAMEKELARQEEERKKRRAELRLLRHAQFEGMDAADKLGLHDAVSAFPELLRLASEDVDIVPDYNRPLIAAASIAARHLQCRAELTADLRRRLAETHEVTVRGSPVLEAIWRGDLRELTPELERMASSTRPPPDPNDVRVSGAEKASLILTAWRETDRLTKTKLDAMLTGRIGGSGAIPEVLRTEFAALSAQDQLAFRQFINWMRTVDVPWSRCRYLENAFTPHTPRPDIAFER